MRSVCGEEEETAENHLLQCDACRAFVHMDCYGVAASPESALWLCDVCALGERIPLLDMPTSLNQCHAAYSCPTAWSRQRLAGIAPPRETYSGQPITMWAT